jgi:hypothetical protein
MIGSYTDPLSGSPEGRDGCQGAVAQGFGERSEGAGPDAVCSVCGWDVLFGAFVQEAGEAVFDGVVFGEYLAERFHDGVGAGGMGVVCCVVSGGLEKYFSGGGLAVGVVQELVEVVDVAAEDAHEGLQDVAVRQDRGLEDGGDGGGAQQPAAGDCDVAWCGASCAQVQCVHGGAELFGGG